MIHHLFPRLWGLLFLNGFIYEMKKNAGNALRNVLIKKSSKEAHRNHKLLHADLYTPF